MSVGVPGKPLLVWPSDRNSMDSTMQEEIGLRFFYLIRETRAWMHRQVDSLRLDAGLTNRRHVSVDFTLPMDGAVWESEHRVIVPISLMKKGTLSRLDISDVGQKQATVLTAKQNTYCSQLLLRAAARLLLPNQIDTYEINRRIDCALEAPRGRSEAAARDIREYVVTKVDRKDPAAWGEALIFMQLCANFAENYLFLISMDKCVIENRSMAKFAYDQESPVDLRGTIVTKIRQPLHDLAKVESQHIEVRLPEGLVVRDFRIAEVEGLARREDPYVEARPKRGSFAPREIAHVSLSTTRRSERSAWLLTVQPAKQGLLQFARTAISLVAVLLIAGTILRATNVPIIDWKQQVFPSASASIFLVGPALLMSWMSKQREHELLAVTLEPLRKMLQFTASSLLVLAGVVALPLTSMAWEIGWWIACGLSWLSFVWLLTYLVDQPLPHWLRHWLFS